MVKESIVNGNRLNIFFDFSHKKESFEDSFLIGPYSSPLEHIKYNKIYIDTNKKVFYVCFVLNKIA